MTICPAVRATITNQATSAMTRSRENLAMTASRVGTVTTIAREMMAKTK